MLAAEEREAGQSPALGQPRQCRKTLSKDKRGGGECSSLIEGLVAFHLQESIFPGLEERKRKRIKKRKVR